MAVGKKRGSVAMMRQQKTVVSYGRAYVIRQKNRRRRRKYKWFCMGIGLLVVLVFLLKPNVQAVEDAGGWSDRVRSLELAGYLQAANLTPEETRRLLLPELQEYVTTEDVQLIFEKLGFGEYTEEILGQAQLAAGDVLSRAQWNVVYERLLEKLQVKDTVSQVMLQYLGKVFGEARIMADNGNYDCDLESCRMEYGKKYVVYVQGNLILGICSQEEQKQTEGKDSEKAENGATEQGTEVTDQITVPDTIRVLLTQDQKQNVFREDVWIKCDAEWKLCAGETEDVIPAGEARSCKVWMEEHQTDQVLAKISGDGKLKLCDSDGNEKGTYAGNLHVYRGDSGLWLVNELGMEEYLCGVVPGEMPSSFAPEALKAQAVCARTYAAIQALGTTYETYHADVDDTTACQVYLPANENEAATDAVNATAGEVLSYEGRLASVYYFSTSCGYTTGLEVWQQEPLAYLGKVSLLLSGEQPVSVDDFLKDWSVQAYDSESRFFRWKGELQVSERRDQLMKKIEEALSRQDGKLTALSRNGQHVASVSDFGDCTGIKICDRSDSGAVTDLAVIFDAGEVHVYNENLIRNLIWQICVSLTDKNGENVNTITMLPSAFFTLQEQENGRYEIMGGGLGHGIGMSQYGADGMARAGKTAAEILQYFFPGTELFLGK